MSFTYDRFGSTYAGGVVLPITLHPLSDGTGPITSPMIGLPGRGSFDTLGSGIARPEAHQVTHRGKVLAATAAALQTALDALYALNGQRNLLWKSSDGGTTNRSRYARVLDVRADWGLRNGTPYAIVEMDFELAAGNWRGAAHSETTAIDQVADKQVKMTNGGNVRVRDAIITITASGTAITSVTVYKNGLVYWVWDGTLAVGKSLIVNCGTKSITNNGVDAFVGFTLQAGHTGSDWLPIDPGGEQTIYLYRTGGDNSSTFKLEYADGWA